MSKYKQNPQYVRSVGGGGFLNRKSFTLAEVLITLVIIGVIAAITVPTIMQNTNNQEIISQTKKAYASISNAIKLAQVDLGSVGDNSALFANLEETDAQVLSKMAKYFNGATVCIDENSENSCKELNNYKLTYDASYSSTWGYPMLILPDGTFIRINRSGLEHPTACSFESNPSIPNDNCVNIEFDVNGFKKPNKWDRDVHSVVITKKTIKTNDGESTLKNILSGKDKLN